jgi:glycine C-acetyltransferase
MDSKTLIELERMPFKQRLEKQWSFYLGEVAEGYLGGREGYGPVDTRMYYKDLHSDEFREVLVFGSNSYLGFSNDPQVKQRVCEAVQKYGIGSGGSPAFSGYTSQHRDLEKRLAKLADHEDAVLLPGGYMANLCWVHGLMNKNDVLVYDKNSHASVINAIKMTGVSFYSFDPDNLSSLEQLFEHIKTKNPSVQIFSTVEGVRSTDGTIINLRGFIELCEKYDVITILDDAHGLGTVGKTGKGTLEHLDLMGRVDLRMSTCSKAIGAQGAFISGSKEFIFLLRNFSYPYVFTSGLAQPTIAAINAALDLIETETPSRISQLHANVRYMQDGLEAMGLKIIRGESGIIPVFLKDGVARKLNRALYQRGLFANIMEYPMVPPGLERLRLSIMSIHTQAQMDAALALIRKVADELDVFDRV